MGCLTKIYPNLRTRRDFCPWFFCGILNMIIPGLGMITTGWIGTEDVAIKTGIVHLLTFWLIVPWFFAIWDGINLMSLALHFRKKQKENCNGKKDIITAVNVMESQVDSILENLEKDPLARPSYIPPDDIPKKKKKDKKDKKKDKKKREKKKKRNSSSSSANPSAKSPQNPINFAIYAAHQPSEGGQKTKRSKKHSTSTSSSISSASS